MNTKHRFAIPILYPLPPGAYTINTLKMFTELSPISGRGEPGVVHGSHFEIIPCL